MRFELFKLSWAYTMYGLTLSPPLLATVCLLKFQTQLLAHCANALKLQSQIARIDIKKQKVELNSHHIVII